MHGQVHNCTVLPSAFAPGSLFFRCFFIMRLFWRRKNVLFIRELIGLRRAVLFRKTQSGYVRDEVTVLRLESFCTDKMQSFLSFL